MIESITYIPVEDIRRRTQQPQPQLEIAPNVQDLQEVIDRSFTIPVDRLPDIMAREHLCRPYPGGNYDILLINVPSTFQQGVIPDGEEAPHGLLRMVAAATEYGKVDPSYPTLNAGILDAHRLNLDPESIGEQVQKTRSKVVGLNPTSVNVHEAQQIAEELDRIGVPYIIGGVHATLDASIARNDFPTAAAVVRGTGELAIGPLVTAVLDGGKKPKINGVYWTDSDHKTNERTDDIDVGKLPIVRQDILVEEPVYKHTVLIDGKPQKIDEANLFVTYGCPFDCTFCASPIMVGRNERNGRPAYRRPDMELILDNVEHVVRALGANAIHFLDDMAFINPDHIDELHAGLIDRGLLGEFIWRGLTRAPVINKFSDQTMKRMKDTGAWKIALGVESGSNEVLASIKKKVTAEQVKEAVGRLSLAEIQSKGFFIFGFPGETLDQMQETRALINDLKAAGMSEISAFQYKPYPGTESFALLSALKPDLVPRLSYLRSYLRHQHQATDGTKANAKAADTPWLPDDLEIAAVPSGVVREQVVGALRDFYGSVPDHLQ